MAIKEFTYYLHDDHDSIELREDIESQIGEPINEELAQRIGRPFYEVTLRCTLDTETGEVRVLETEL